MYHYSIKVNDWEKFNPRTDSKNHTWFRFQNSFFTKSFSLSPEEQRLFIYLCCLCSQERKSTINLDTDLGLTLLKRKRPQIIQDLKGLEERGFITLSNGPDNSKLHEVTSKVPVPTDIHTDNTEHTYTQGVSSYHWLAVIWNENCGEKLPRVQDTGQSRLAKINTRIKEHPEKQFWIDVVKKAAATPFCCGSGKTGWRASFDFLIDNSDNATKILEGKYDGFKKNGISWDPQEVSA